MDAAALPAELWTHTFLFLCGDGGIDNARELTRLGLVSKSWRTISRNNDLWQTMFLLRYPFRKSHLRIPSWFTMYKRRVLYEKDFGKDTEVIPIEDCNWEYECPLNWRDLSGQGTVKFCNVCFESVYWVTNKAELVAAQKLKRCVAFALPGQQPDLPKTAAQQESDDDELEIAMGFGE